MSHLQRLTMHIETSIASLLPDQFSLTFDNWSCGTTHFLAIFVLFHTKNEVGGETSQISFSPLTQEDEPAPIHTSSFWSLS